jgi:hypothetical protein
LALPTLVPQLLQFVLLSYHWYATDVPVATTVKLAGVPPKITLWLDGNAPLVMAVDVLNDTATALDVTDGAQIPLITTS